MATYYAWSVIKTGSASGTKPTKTFNPGDKVTAKDLEVEEDEFKIMIAEGSVREQKWPVPQGSSDSPVVHLQKQAAAVSEGDLSSFESDDDGDTS